MRAVHWLDDYAGWVLAAGLIGIGLSTYRQWKKPSSPQNADAPLPKLPILPSYPKVSLLIPAWNEAGLIAELIKSALALRYPNKEIVVCAGGQDNTYQLVKAFEEQGVLVLEQTSGMGKQKALQRCLERSGGEIIYLTDADCLLDDTCFEATIAPIVAGEERVTTGFFEPFTEKRANLLVEYQWWHHSHWQKNQPEYAQTLDGANAAISRNVLESVGGFSAPASIGTDYTLSKILTTNGNKIRTIPNSRVKTEYAETACTYLRQISRWFRNRLVLGMRYQAWEDVISSVRGGGSALAILALPITGWVRSRFVFSVWVIITVRAFLQNWLVLATHEGEEQSQRTNQSVKMALLFTPLNLLGMAKGLVDSLMPAYKHRW